MSTRVALIISTLALVLSVGGSAGATDYGYVPLGPYGSVSLASSSAAWFPLTLTTPQYGYGALQTKDYQGAVTSTISNNGELWIRPNANYPRLVLSSASYTGPDTFVEQIGSSPVMAIAAGGEVESYNYYVGADDPRFSVRDVHDNLTGGLDAAGGLITSRHTAPDPAHMANGEARIWFDPTPTTGGLMVTEKDSAGGVKTVRIG